MRRKLYKQPKKYTFKLRNIGDAYGNYSPVPKEMKNLEVTTIGDEVDEALELAVDLFEEVAFWNVPNWSNEERVFLTDVIKVEEI